MTSSTRHCYFRGVTLYICWIVASVSALDESIATTHSPYTQSSASYSSVTCIVFNAKTCSKGAAGFATFSGTYTSNAYVIYIHGTTNSNFGAGSKIYAKRNGVDWADAVYTDQYDCFSSGKWFWVSWQPAGVVTLGRGQTVGVDHLMTFNDDSPITINFVAFSSTALFHNGLWTVPDEFISGPVTSCVSPFTVISGDLTGLYDTSTQPDRSFSHSGPKYQYTDVGIDLSSRNWAVLQVKSCYNGFMALSSAAGSFTAPFYEVLFDQKLTGSSKHYTNGYEYGIRRDGTEVSGSESSLGRTTSCASYRWVWVSWQGGIIMAGSGLNIGQNVHILYNDVSPFSVTTLGIGSSSDASSNWIIPGYFYPTATTTPPVAMTTAQSTSTPELTTTVTSTTQLLTSPVTTLWTSEISITPDVVTNDLSVAVTSQQTMTSVQSQASLLTSSPESTTATTSESLVDTDTTTETNIVAKSSSSAVTDTATHLTVDMTTADDVTLLPAAATLVCPKPPASMNVVITLSRDVYGYIAVYTCKIGHVFAEGGYRRVAVCTHGNWTPDDLPGCYAVSCHAIQLVAGLLTTPYDVTHGDVIRGVCPGQGRLRNGLSFDAVKCTSVGHHGVLHTVQSACDYGGCQPVPYVENATSVFSQTNHSTTLKCFRGHRFPDGSRLTTISCHSDGSWDVLSHCQVQFCAKLPLLSNGTLSTDVVVYGTQVTMTCNRGFIQSDGNLTETVECVDGDPSLVWNDTVDDCQPVYCVNPGNVINAQRLTLSGVMTSSHFTFESRLRYDCDGGRRFEDGLTSRIIRCDVDGNWNDTDFTCEYGRCAPVPTVLHAVPDSLLSTNNSVITYACQTGYHFPASASRDSVTCDGIVWNGQVPDCILVQCPVLNVSHGRVSVKSRDYLAEAEVICDVGFRVIGNWSLTNTTVVCEPSGEWSIADVTCQPVDCGQPQSVQNASLMTSSMMSTYLSNVTHSCLPGHFFHRGVFDKSVTCSANGLWLPRHIDACVPVTCVRLTSQLVNTSRRVWGTVVNVTCGINRTFSDTKQKSPHVVAICDQFGHWQPHVTDCIGRDQGTPVEQVEAQSSNIIGTVCAGVIASVMGVLLILDLTTIRNSLQLLRSNIRSSPHH